MISVRRAFFWMWRPQFHRLHFGFRIYLPGIIICVGHDTPPCRVCRKRDGIISWMPDNPGAAICPDCCEHDDYQYERGEQDYFCEECGQAAPYEWIADRSCDDDCGFSFGSGERSSGPLGTPISQLSGRPGHPGYEEFVRIAKSWGYD